MYKASLKDPKESSVNKIASPNKTLQSPVKKSKSSTSLTHNGNDEMNKSLKKKKRDKDKDKERCYEYDKPVSERFSKIDQGNNKLSIYKHKSPTVTPGNNFLMKRKHDESDETGGVGTSMQSRNIKSMSYKRLKMEDGSRNRNERNNQHHRDDYYGEGNSHDGVNTIRVGSGDRRSSINSPSTPNSRMHHSNSRLTPSTIPSAYMECGSGGGSGERWSHNRDRYGNSDFKRDRYESYNNRIPGSGYHRDHRDRDRRTNKRR